MADKWEYKIEFLYRLTINEIKFTDKTCDKYQWQEDTENFLNKLGADGWELVQMTEKFLECGCVDGWGVFKRRKETENNDKDNFSS